VSTAASPGRDAEFYREPVADDDELPTTTEDCSEDTTSERGDGSPGLLLHTTSTTTTNYYSPQSAVSGTKSQAGWPMTTWPVIRHAWQSLDVES